MVVTAQHLATEAGVAVLRQGGNAVDAAVAVGYALAVVYPAAGNIGGGGFMTIRLADGRQTFLDFREKAPLAATRDMYLDAKGESIAGLSLDGYRAAAVPGSVAGLEYARQRYGTLGRARLLAPAISLARRGFLLDQGDVDLLSLANDDFRRDAPSAAVFLPNGAPLKVHERLVQADLARSLQLIAKEGPAAMYQGAVGAAIVAASERGNGIFSQADFQRYDVRELPPIECDYRGFHVVSAPPPSSGGVIVCEILKVLEGYPLRELGFHSAQAAHYEIEAMRHAYVDRNFRLGDPTFVENPVRELLDEQHIGRIRAAIDPNRAADPDTVKPGAPPHEGENTTHYSIADQHGNVVAVTYTLNRAFGARVMAAGTGILLNDEMDDFATNLHAPNLSGLVQGEQNAIAPGKRPLSSMSPTIVSHAGAPVLVIGSPGGSRIITAVVQTIVNVIDYQMNIQEAIDAPRFHQQWQPQSTEVEKFAFSPDTRQILLRMGQLLGGPPPLTHAEGILIGAPRLESSPIPPYRFFGANDPRLGTGLALGY